MVDVQELDKLIEAQIKIMKEVMSHLPERDIHATFIGDPRIGSSIFTLRVIQQALHGDDYYLRKLAELTPPLMP